MARLSTHVLDIRAGRPAAGVAIRLFRLEGEARRLLVETRTNADGRTDQPLLASEAGQPGAYELEFAIGDYFRAADAPLSEPAFLDVVPIRFAIAEQDGHYHVPLLCSPWAYSTYRGS
jgi:5-hydroxyisourate hydrolase